MLKQENTLTCCRLRGVDSTLNFEKVMSEALIIAGGAPVSTELLDKLLDTEDLIICADSGAEIARKEWIIPDYIVGDFDSVKPKILDYFRRTDEVEIIHIADQETTDLEKAINLALKCKADIIRITAAGGSRADHFLHNIGLLFKYGRKAEMFIVDDENCLEFKRASFTADCSPRERVSLLAWNGVVRGVTTSGLRYPLNSENLVPGERESISNETTGYEFSVSFASGELLLIRPTQYCLGGVDE